MDNRTVAEGHLVKGKVTDPHRSGLHQHIFNRVGFGWFLKQICLHILSVHGTVYYVKLIMFKVVAGSTQILDVAEVHLEVGVAAPGQDVVNVQIIAQATDSAAMAVGSIEIGFGHFIAPSPVGELSSAHCLDPELYLNGFVGFTPAPCNVVRPPTKTTLGAFQPGPP